MPRSDRAAPRNMLPPPTTTATCTPSRTASAIESARWATTSGSMPSFSPPANASPDSLSMTRFQRSRPWRGEAADVAGLVSSCTAAASFVTSTVERLLTTGSRLADLVPGEGQDLDPGLLRDLADRLLVVLDERLLQQGEVLVPGVQPALDDLRDRGLGLALLAGHPLVELALLLDDLGGHGVRAEVLGRHGGGVLGDVLGDLGVRLVELDQHADGRRELRVGLVQVGGDVPALQQREPADLDLLAERGVGLVQPLLDGLAVDLGLEQGGHVGWLGGRDVLDDVPGERLEPLVLGDEVGLTVELEQGGERVAHVLDRDQPVRGGAGLALTDVLGALQAQQLDGLVEVA